MTTQHLANLISVNRRYSRSINLERDFDIPEAVDGYILTERAVDALRRILSSMFGRKRTTAWTLTGVYGTGKSAFANYLSSLVGPSTSPARQTAFKIARHSLQTDSAEYKTLSEELPNIGLFRAIATAQREPLSYTLVRALNQAADSYWKRGKEPEVAKKLTDWSTELEFGQPSFSDRDVLQLVGQLAEVLETNILIIVDELGKSLEYAAQNQGTADLYLLQQLAELPRKNGTRLYVVGLLHQAFEDYSQRLASTERNEWAKIQGRFEDIPFTESSQQMLRLVGQAINRPCPQKIPFSVPQLIDEWCNVLKQETNLPELSPRLLNAAYPLHPITALVLPELCIRYAQNDRSLFTFLTSAEPHAFQDFLNHTEIKEGQFPTLKLHHLYDYFSASLNAGIGSRSGLQHWLEIQALVTDAAHRGQEVVNLLKTIGLLNLVTSTGIFKAARSLVKLALVDQPSYEALEKWDQQIDRVCYEQGIVTHRRAADELRLWEGSDFEVENKIAEYIAKTSLPLAALLSETYPLQPMVAQRHSYRTGTLRYFERHYIDKVADLENLTTDVSDCDGVIVYWLSAETIDAVPATTDGGKPVLVIAAANLPLLHIRAQEYYALCQIQKKETALRTDKVAQREVRHRRLQLKHLLDDTLTQAFDFSVHHNDCWVEGVLVSINSTTTFNALLSDVCDRTYAQTPVLWNELINRRTLTSQAAKARRVLIEAMLEHIDEERLGLEGYGPEVAIYYSMLQQTGIHRQEQGEWGFYPPQVTENENVPTQKRPSVGGSSLNSIWDAIAQFCLKATDTPMSLGELYRQLEAPPYGMKQGAVPVLLAAVLLYYADEVSVYKDGTFIPVLGPEHFELLVKDPARFSVKHIEVTGVRSHVFRELELILRSGTSQLQTRQNIRNLTILSVVKPLIQFVRKLPNFTLKTRRISDRSRQVLHTLLHTQEPDDLLFKALPQACGLDPVIVGKSSEADDDDNGSTARVFRERLVEALREINAAYDMLLKDCQGLLYNAFGLHSDRDKLRQDLQFRAHRLLGNCVEASLNRFARAAADNTSSDRSWLEAVVMVIADKPAESWTDQDFTQFELNLSHLSRRFKNLEALQASVKATGKGGFESRRVTVTRPDGTEVNQMVWMDHEQQSKVDPLIDQMLQQCPDPQLRQALLTRWVERMFDEPELATEKQRAKSKVQKME